jgi:hypothetical protein
MATMMTSAIPNLSPLTLASWAPVLFVGPGPNGGWLVQEMHGLIGGQFTNRKAALSFARSECRFRLGRVVEIQAS